MKKTQENQTDVNTETTEEFQPKETPRPAKRIYRLEYKLLANGVPVGDPKYISVEANTEDEAKERAKQELRSPVFFTGGIAQSKE